MHMEFLDYMHCEDITNLCLLECHHIVLGK